jgi:hypothetical protein
MSAKKENYDENEEKLSHYRFTNGVPGQGTESAKDVFGDSIR